MPQQKLILVAATTGYQTKSFAEAANRLGVQVVLATDRCHVLEDPWADGAIPVQFDEPERAAAAIAEAASDASGIVAVADRPTVVAALAAQEIGLVYHSPEAVRVCRDKRLAREAFQAGGLPVPRHYAVHLDTRPGDAVERATFPCVIKPLGLSASRGVIRANNVKEAIAAFERIRAILQQPELAHTRELIHQSIQFEEYIPGREFALEGLVSKGVLRTLAIFDKPDPLEGPFFEETIYVTPSRESPAVQHAIIGTAARAVQALGLSDGPLHAEMRVNEDGVWMLEAAARPIGGLCARMLQFQGGLTLEEVVILHALGGAPEILTSAVPASGVMMLPVPTGGILQRVDGVEAAKRTGGITDLVVTAKLGERLVPLPEGASYLGFLFASGDSASEVEQSLRQAHSRLSFEILGALNVLRG